MAEQRNTELETLKADFTRLNQTVSDLAKDVKTLVGATLQEGGERARTGARDALDEVKGKMQEARVYGRKYAESTEEQIAQHPLSSVGIAFGIGFLLAKIMDLGQRR